MNKGNFWCYVRYQYDNKIKTMTVFQPHDEFQHKKLGSAGF